ncbi:MAG: helix-turn-helix domain-containing protein [Verrucomicrobiota bacterium]
MYTVAELAERWRVHPESVRILIRKRQIRPMRSLRPYRVTFDEVRRYECLSEEDEVREAYLQKRRRRA